MWFAIGRAANFHANYMMGVRQQVRCSGQNSERYVNPLSTITLCTTPANSSTRREDGRFVPFSKRATLCRLGANGRVTRSLVRALSRPRPSRIAMPAPVRTNSQAIFDCDASTAMRKRRLASANAMTIAAPIDKCGPTCRFVSSPRSP
jgi:hypothetical protein